MIECYDEKIYAYVELLFSCILFFPMFVICIGGVIYTAAEWAIKHWRNHR